MKRINSSQEKTAILNSLTDLVVLQSPLNKIVWANKATAKAFHTTPRALAGKICYEAFHRLKQPCPRCPVVKVAVTGKPQSQEMISPDGRVWVIQGTPIRNKKGAIQGIMEVATDITKRKRAEKALKELNKDLLEVNKKLNQLSLRDTLTGLFNHRFFSESIDAEFYRARRHATTLSVLMLDIDYFKSINDVYGHVFGDLVLKQLSRLLQKIIRRYDILARFGSEEFVILSPNTDRATALILAQRILDTVNLFNFGNKDHTVKLKLSIAVTTHPEDKVTKGIELIDLAEKILSKAKDQGGNRVCSSLDLHTARKQHSMQKKDIPNVKALQGRLAQLNKRARQSLIEAVFAFAKTIEVKDHYTAEHTEKTVRYATEIARALNLPQEDVDHIKQAAMLHDLGKIGVSEQILNKRAKLSPQEFKEVKKHTQIGVDILRPIQFLHALIPLILYHHERWDGKGYPQGLQGDEIPIGARIVALADVYQALTSDRPYRKAYSKKKAVEIIKQSSGTHFDPQVVETFLKIIQKSR